MKDVFEEDVVLLFIQLEIKHGRGDLDYDDHDDDDDDHLARLERP